MANLIEGPTAPRSRKEITDSMKQLNTSSGQGPQSYSNDSTESSPFGDLYDDKRKTLMKELNTKLGRKGKGPV